MILVSGYYLAYPIARSIYDETQTPKIFFLETCTLYAIFVATTKENTIYAICTHS